MGEITIKHVEGLNYVGVTALAQAAYVEMSELGFGSDEIMLHWEQNVVIALDGIRPIGVMIWTDDKPAKGLWLVLSYVIPERRREGIFTAMWAALVDKAEEKKMLFIRSMTSVHNFAMREAAAAVGRVEDCVRTVYCIPQIRESVEVMKLREPESDDAYRMRLLLLVGQGSVNTPRLATASGAVLDAIGSYYEGGKRR